MDLDEAAATEKKIKKSKKKRSAEDTETGQCSLYLAIAKTQVCTLCRTRGVDPCVSLAGCMCTQHAHPTLMHQLCLLTSWRCGPFAHQRSIPRQAAGASALHMTVATAVSSNLLSEARYGGFASAGRRLCMMHAVCPRSGTRARGAVTADWCLLLFNFLPGACKHGLCLISMQISTDLLICLMRFKTLAQRPAHILLSTLISLHDCNLLSCDCNLPSCHWISTIIKSKKHSYTMPPSNLLWR